MVAGVLRGYVGYPWQCVEKVCSWQLKRVRKEGVLDKRICWVPLAVRTALTSLTIT